MYGIKDPVIRERSWRAERETTAEQLSRDIAFFEDINFHVHEVHFVDRTGKPVIVVWIAGRRAGNLFSAYEITEREDTAEPWMYSHTGWSAHSGAGGARHYWLACYASGEQVGTYDSSMGLLVRFGSYEAALRRAKQLNRELGIA
jgi:hypothetical protein